MSTQTASMDPDVMAHHEAGHAVAGIVLGIGLIYIRIVMGEDGKIGVKPKTNPWTAPRPSSKPQGEFTDEEWAELSQSDEKWDDWVCKDNDRYAVYYLAGKAAQIEYAGTAKDEDAKFDYSFIEYRLPNCYARLGELEVAAREFVKSHWHAVQAVAAQLLERSELTPGEVEELIQQTREET
jgi:hypothetical protein